MLLEIARIADLMLYLAGRTPSSVTLQSSKGIAGLISMYPVNLTVVNGP
jgi:hypothetical protein